MENSLQARVQYPVDLIAVHWLCKVHFDFCDSINLSFCLSVHAMVLLCYLLHRVMWERSYPMRQDDPYVTSSPIGRDRSRVILDIILTLVQV